MKSCVLNTDKQNCGHKKRNGIYSGEGQRKDGNHVDDTEKNKCGV